MIVTSASRVQELLDAAPQVAYAAMNEYPSWNKETATDLLAREKAAEWVARALDVVLYSDLRVHIAGHSWGTDERTLIYPAGEETWWTAVVRHDGCVCASSEPIPSERVADVLVLHGSTATRWKCTKSPAYSSNPFGEVGAPEGDMDRRHVYFIEGRDTGNIKIGLSGDVDRRFRQLCNASSEPLELIGYIPRAGRAVERRFHDRFAKQRMHGEWFSYSLDLYGAAVDAIHEAFVKDLA